ncbi:hypothetical protein [Streptomyces sp. bgisy084]|uniref:hypothetical protein n=1 Tax=unclassified Streptomyces TaxID=2593676 RepID=UPI003D746945
MALSDAASAAGAGRRSVLVLVCFPCQALVEVARPLLGPASQGGDGVIGEAVGGEFLVVVSLGAGQTVAQVIEAEGVVSVALAELLELRAGVAFGGGVGVDEVPDSAAIGQGADFGADGVVE